MTAPLPKPPPGALIPLPPLVRGKVRYLLHAVPGPAPAFRVTDPDGRSADGATPELAFAALQAAVTPEEKIAPMFHGWLVPRTGERLIQRAWIVARADKRGSMLLYPRDADMPSPDADTSSIPRLWGGQHVYIQPGLAAGERCAPRLVPGVALPVYRTDGHDATGVWADLLHDEDPRVPGLRKVLSRALFRQAVVRALPLPGLLTLGSVWRSFPTMQEIALHAKRSGGAGVWAFRERTLEGRKRDAVLFSYAIAANSTPEHPRVVNESGAARLPLRTESPYAFHTAARGDWRPVHRRSLAPMAWPEAPPAPGDTVLAFAPSVRDRHGKTLTVVAVSEDGKSVLLTTKAENPKWVEQRSYPLSQVRILARAPASPPAP